MLEFLRTKVDCVRLWISSDLRQGIEALRQMGSRTEIAPIVPIVPIVPFVSVALI